MAYTTITNGTASDADAVMANFAVCGKPAGSDQTAGSHTGDTDETEIGEVSIAANTVTTGVLVLASGKCKMEIYSETATIRLRAGTSTTGTGNALQKAITRVTPAAEVIIDGGWTIIYYITGLTWTSTNYLNITAEHSNSSAAMVSTCESIEVLYF